MDANRPPACLYNKMNATKLFEYLNQAHPILKILLEPYSTIETYDPPHDFTDSGFDAIHIDLPYECEFSTEVDKQCKIYVWPDYDNEGKYIYSIGFPYFDDGWHDEYPDFLRTGEEVVAKLRKLYIEAGKYELESEDRWHGDWDKMGKKTDPVVV